MKKEQRSKEQLAKIIANAFHKAGFEEEQEPDFETPTGEKEDVFYLGEEEMTILFFNSRVVAFTSWTYDGTWFAVVDLEKEELLLSSTDSTMYNEEDRLVIY